MASSKDNAVPTPPALEAEVKRIVALRALPTTRGDAEDAYTYAREVVALREYAREATKAITSLTVGGSEFFGRKIGDIYTADLPFCVNQIKERETRAHQRWIDAWSELSALRPKREEPK